MRSRSVSVRDVKILYGKSAGRCNICRIRLFEPMHDESGLIHIGQMAHNISFSEKNTSPRFIDELSGDNSYHNLILLCPNDHARVDQDTNFFTFAKLKEIKCIHEALADSPFQNFVNSDQSIVQLVNSYVNFQKIYFLLDYGYSQITCEIILIADMENYVLYANQPSYYPFHDSDLNLKMTALLNSYNELRPYLMRYYFGAANNYLAPTLENPIPNEEIYEITEILKKIKLCVGDWLSICRYKDFIR